MQSLRDQERAYSGLCHSHKSLGNLQEALVYSEKRLVVAHELGNEAKAAAFGDLGMDLFSNSLSLSFLFALPSHCVLNGAELIL